MLASLRVLCVQLKHREDEDRGDQMRKMVPLELWRLVDWLLQNGLDEVCIGRSSDTLPSLRGVGNSGAFVSLLPRSINTFVILAKAQPPLNNA
jgi:hypothetical protein